MESRQDMIMMQCHLLYVCWLRATTGGKINVALSQPPLPLTDSSFTIHHSRMHPTSPALLSTSPVVKHLVHVCLRPFHIVLSSLLDTPSERLSDFTRHSIGGPARQLEDSWHH